MIKNNKLPVIILSGLLGARKTTLLNHVPDNKEGMMINGPWNVYMFWNKRRY